MPDPVYIAKCPDHGLHGERVDCFVCGGEVEHVAFVPAAELEVLRDTSERLLSFGGDDATLMPWVDVHRRHKSEPYIGCPFCRDQFVARDKYERLREALSLIAQRRFSMESHETPAGCMERLAAEALRAATVAA